MSVPSTTPATGLHEILRERLQDKIKASFIELIPEELFNGMLDSAVDEFLHGPRRHRFRSRHEWLPADDVRNTTGKSGYCSFEEPFVDEKYNVYADPNTLPGMVYAELVGTAKSRVAEAVKAHPGLQQQPDADTGNLIVPIVSQIVGDNAAAFMRALMTGVVSWTVSQAVNNMRAGVNMPGYVPPPPGL